MISTRMRINRTILMIICHFSCTIFRSREKEKEWCDRRSNESQHWAAPSRERERASAREQKICSDDVSRQNCELGIPCTHFAEPKDDEKRAADRLNEARNWTESVRVRRERRNRGESERGNGEKKMCAPDDSSAASTRTLFSRTKAKGKGCEITYDWMESEWKICFDGKNSNYTVIYVKWTSSHWRRSFNPMADTECPSAATEPKGEKNNDSRQ